MAYTIDELIERRNALPDILIPLMAAGRKKAEPDPEPTDPDDPANMAEPVPEDEPPPPPPPKSILELHP